MGHFIVHKGAIEKPAETQTSIRLVRAPNSRSLRREFESPMRREQLYDQVPEKGANLYFRPCC